MSVTTEELREAVVFLGAAGLVVPAIHRLRVSPALGFLVVGLIVSPFGLGRFAERYPWLAHVVIEDRKAVEVAADFGVIFLMFMIGLELSLERLRAMWRYVFLLGGAQVALSATAIAAVAAYAGFRLDVAAVLGGAFAMSSTAIVVHLLAETGRLGTPAGQASFGVLLFQDLSVVPILFMIGALGMDSGSLAAAMELAVGKAIMVIFLILGLGRLIARPLFRLVAATRSRELFLAAVLLTVIGASVGAQAVELSSALGAFLAGLLLADTEYRHRIAVDVEPFKGLLLGVFFVSVGLSVDLAEIGAEPVKILGSAFGLIALKGVIVYALARLGGLAPGAAFEASMLLGPGGEFAFVVTDVATNAGVIYDDTVQFALLVGGLTMMVAPLLAAFARIATTRAAARSARVEALAQLPGQMSGHVLVVGYGRVGQSIGRLLDSQMIPHVAIDANPGLVARLRGQGAAIYLGDARQFEILARLGLRQATALVVTMDDPETALQTVICARRDGSTLPIYARVRDEDHAAALLDAGATLVIEEAREASLQLGEAVLRGVGVPEEAARGLVEERRAVMQADPSAEAEGAV